MNTRFVISADGTRLAYDVTGQGPLLMLLHGAGKTRRDWHKAGYVDRLKDEFTVVTVDLRGTGESDLLTDVGGYAVEKLCDDLDAVADACGAGRFLIWGYSFGGSVARTFAARSDRAAALAVIGIPLGPVVDEEFDRFISAFVAKWQPLADAYKAGAVTEKQKASAIKGRIPVWVACFQAMRTWPSLPPQAIRCPALLLAGTRNAPAFRWAQAHQAELEGTNVQLAIVDGLDHPQEFTDAERVLPIVRSFFGRHSTRASTPGDPRRIVEEEDGREGHNAARSRSLSSIWYPGHDLLLKDIVRAENCYLYDSQGKQYVDLESGVWCTSIGHANPRILRVLAEQAGRIGHTGFAYTSAIVEEAAREVLALLGFLGGRCVFLCSGSEAVEYGVRVAQATAVRPLLMTMTDSYLGAYGSASKKREDEWFCFDWAACAACCHPHECGAPCEHWAAIPFRSIGGLLFEPGSSSGLVRFPPEKLVRNIAAAIKHDDGLILVNEVTTGVGRTGTWFGYQHYGIAPDIVALGKGIGNGYPVSVTAFAPGVIDRLGSPLKYAQSHQNDPLGAAVAREVIRAIQEGGLIERGAEMAAILVPGLHRIKERTGKIREVRARGLMAAVELEDDPQTSTTIRIHRELVRRGYVVGRRPGVSVLRLDPSLTIGREEIDGFLEALEAALTESLGPAGGAG